MPQAKKAQDFHYSIGVNTNLHYPQYQENYAGLKAALADIGIKFIRGGSVNKTWEYQDLFASHGIKTMFIVSPWLHGLVPNNSYSTTGQNGAPSPQPPKVLLVNHLKSLGSCVHTVELPNEIDLFHPNYVWSQADRTTLSNNKTSPYYWGKWLFNYVRDTYNALKADPATANLKIVGPSPGATYTYGNQNPMTEMSAYVDFACGHYYAPEFNGFQNAGAYAGLSNYYLQGGYPGNAAGRLPLPANYTEADLGANEYGNSALFRANSERPFGYNKPLIMSECGWHTSFSDYGVSYAVQAKGLPRMFAEYFRLGFPQSYAYEFIDAELGRERGASKEASFGLLERDLTMKPAAVQLKVLIDAVKETATDTRAQAGSLDYNLSLSMPSGYTRDGYVKQVLLQKASGNFLLLVYHNIAITNNTQVNPPIAMTHPVVPAILTLPRKYSVKRTTLRTDTTKPTAVFTGPTQSCSFEITDTVTILELTPESPMVLTSQNINCTSGSMSFTGNKATLRNVGNGIRDTADSFTFGYTSGSTDGAIEAYCLKPSNINSFTKSGVMYRASSAAGSPFYALLLMPDGSLLEQSRLTANTNAQPLKYLLNANSNPGLYLRINKIGNTYGGQYKTSASAAWTNLPTQSVNLGSTTLKGICLSSRSTSQATANFENIILS